MMGIFSIHTQAGFVTNFLNPQWGFSGQHIVPLLTALNGIAKSIWILAPARVFRLEPSFGTQTD